MSLVPMVLITVLNFLIYKKAHKWETYYDVIEETTQTVNTLLYFELLPLLQKGPRVAKNY